MSGTTNTLTQKSLESQGNFSSSTHILDSLNYENSKKGYGNFQIDDRYYQNCIRILPVNVSKYYIYWELNEDKTSEFLFNIYANNTLVHKFNSKDSLGEFYLNESYDDSDLFVTVGYVKNDKYIETLQSNTIHTFNTTIKYPKIDDQVWLSKSEKLSKLIYRSVENSSLNFSSEKLADEMKWIEYLSQKQITQLSSSNLQKKVEND